MKQSGALETNYDEILEVVEQHNFLNKRVFGSVLHRDDHEGSDIDILFDSNPENTLFDLDAVRHELFQLLGVLLDVLTPHTLLHSFHSKAFQEALLL